MAVELSSLLTPWLIFSPVDDHTVLTEMETVHGSKR